MLNDTYYGDLVDLNFISKIFHLNIIVLDKRINWKKDKTGRMLNEPIDSFNHLIDPLRYVALNKLASKIKQEYSFDWN